jgi:hypothetical protein
LHPHAPHPPTQRFEPSGGLAAVGPQLLDPNLEGRRTAGLSFLHDKTWR